MTYIIEFRNGEWLRISQEQGEKLVEALLQDNVPKFFSVNGNSYATNTITKVEKSV